MDETAGGRRGGRAARARAVAARVEQRPWKIPENPFPPLAVVPEDELEAIHDAALSVLEETGIEVLDAEAREILKAGGAEVESSGTRVRFPRGLVEGCIGLAPERFTLHARNPERNLPVGGRHMLFAMVASAPNCSDPEGGRRPGSRADFRRFVQLGHVLNVIHLHGGYAVEPVDLHPRIRHLEALRDIATLSDKVFHAYSLGRERVRDALEIVRIVRGISRERLVAEPSLLTIVNTSSPLRLDGPMAAGIVEMARAGQAVCVTPFTLAGAMAPVTVAGAVVQQHAEALAGLVLCQLARPGAPFIYGAFTSNVDMKSGAPAFGTPEYMKSTLLGGQLARRLRLPYRASNTNAANALDFQAACESVFSLWAATMAGTHLVKHAAGWMEGGLRADFLKVVLDAELLQWISAFLEPLATGPEDLALDAIREVGPGGHFFAAAHTRARYRDAFYTPLVSDWRNHGAWLEAGAPEAPRHAQRVLGQLLAEYEPPPMDPAIREELDDFVTRRIREGGVPTDY
jgi:trimethylamine--corrinoid protein Co-methyltransferase